MPLFKFKCGLCSSSCPFSKLALFLELKRPTLESQPLDLGGSNRKIPPRNGVENRQELFLEKHRALFNRCLLMRRIRQIRESMRSKKKIQFHEALVRAKRFASRPLHSAQFKSAGGGARTHTPLRIPDFESSASANSATPAKAVKEIRGHSGLCKLRGGPKTS